MKKVLVIDDAAFMRFSLKNILENNGFEVAGVAGNGDEGFRLYKDTHPDIVTMDITMPDKNGIEALALIMDYDPNAKVVMVSALGQESLVREAIMKGAKSFIVKPFKEEQLIKTLTKILN